MDLPAVRLPRSYDPARLQADLERTRSLARVPQFGPYHRGEWAGISLYSEGGDAGTTRTGRIPTGQPFAPTAVLRDAPYLRELLEELACPKRSVRLLDLPPGGRVEKHVDAPLTFQHGILRLHVPVVTHRDVIFVIDGHRCDWREGELWWGDFSREHWVYNESPVTRVHLVVDVEIDDFVIGLFPPDFLAAKESRGIARHRAPIAVDLGRFEAALRVPPRTVPLPELREGGAATVRVIDGALRLCAGGRSLLVLEPVSETSLRVVGWSSGMTFECGFEGERMRALAFRAAGLPLRIEEQASAQNPIVAERILPIEVVS